jgi:hypothetical protein
VLVLVRGALGVVLLLVVTLLGAEVLVLVLLSADAAAPHRLATRRSI